MSKIYFEMNDKEKQLRHIGDTIDYAICMFAEGLSGTGEYNIPTEEVIDLQSKIADNLISVQADMEKLLKAVEEKEEDEQTLVFNPIGGTTEIKEVKDCEVHLVKEAGNAFGTEIVFLNFQSGMYKSLIINDDGELSMSQWY